MTMFRPPDVPPPPEKTIAAHAPGCTLAAEQAGAFCTSSPGAQLSDSRLQLQQRGYVGGMARGSIAVRDFAAQLQVGRRRGRGGGCVGARLPCQRMRPRGRRAAACLLTSAVKRLRSCRIVHDVRRIRTLV
jgi:hypothetical protein